METKRLPLVPWADPAGFFDDCTRCGACVSACPMRLLTAGDGGFPEADFRRGECTFCGACRTACPEGVLKQSAARPWALKALISDACLSRQGVSCQSCRDSCGAGAIRFPPKLGGRSSPEVEADLCSGCGACVLPCPVSAIRIDVPEQVKGPASLETSLIGGRSHG